MKCKKRLLKIGILCLMPLLALLLCLNNTYAWYVDDDGNLASSNLITNWNQGEAYRWEAINSNNSNICYSLVENVEVGYYTIKINNRVNNANVQVHKWYGQQTIVNWTDESTFYVDHITTLAINYAYEGASQSVSPSDMPLFEIMLNKGSSAVPYEAFNGVYINPNNIDFMQYLIGNNYFSHGRASIVQTSNGNYWDRQLINGNYVTGSTISDETIGQYINGNVLNIASLSQDLVADLVTKSAYNSSYSTFIMIKPALAINGTATYPPIECRYVSLDIYVPNSLAVASCLVGSTTEVDSSNTRIEFRKNGDWIRIRFDEDNYNYLWDIDIKIDYSNGSYVIPQNCICNTDDNPNFNMYDLGVESGYQKGLVEGKQKGYDEGRGYGYSEGYGTGYNVGYNEGASQNFETTGFRTLLTSILSYPVNLIRNSLNFEFMGVNIANIVMFIVSLGIVAFVIKEFKD